ncbi:MAG: NADP-dependent isocitrate dehydrogenase [Deltaproteobacteria bacterium]|nr:NADP-dependent isocitrate dehydrogenase [Deltaproteobacteria bacterium]
MAAKIEMKTPIVEMDGDEMARIMWHMVRKRLIEPYVALNTVYYDLGLENRDRTDDRVTVEAAEAVKKYGVGVKCATITPNADRVKEYGLKKQWKSPNGTIRAMLDGTVFREPIVLANIKPAIRFWKKPIIIGRHAYGDVYQNTEHAVDGPCKAELVLTMADGRQVRETIHEFGEAGIVQATHNLIASIENFARACFSYGLDRGVPVWFATKDTVSKTYDGTFKALFERVFTEEGYEKRFKEAGIEFFYTLIDDAVARMVRSEGGFLWACKNYDGDVMSDLVGSAYGSLGLLTSVLVSPGGCVEYEAAHGTVQRHYYQHLKREKTSTNPTAIIFAWSGALRKRGQLDKVSALETFADHLENAVRQTIETDGIMTGDLARISEVPARQVATTEAFIAAVGERLAGSFRPEIP